MDFFEKTITINFTNTQLLKTKDQKKKSNAVKKGHTVRVYHRAPFQWRMITTNLSGWKLFYAQFIEIKAKNNIFSFTCEFFFLLLYYKKNFDQINEMFENHTVIVNRLNSLNHTTKIKLVKLLHRPVLSPLSPIRAP